MGLHRARVGPGCATSCNMPKANLSTALHCLFIPMDDRWCSKDAGMPYTGTRVNTRLVDGYQQMDGTASFVSNSLSDAPVTAPYSNAGECCLLA